jgi:hypothetical protein
MNGIAAIIFALLQGCISATSTTAEPEFSQERSPEDILPDVQSIVDAPGGVIEILVAFPDEDGTLESEPGDIQVTVGEWVRFLLRDQATSDDDDQ